MMNLPFVDIPPMLRRIREDGACSGYHSPDEFFPTQHDQAKYLITAFCRSCPVRRECLQWALDNREWGVWGGLTDRQRSRLRNQT